MSFGKRLQQACDDSPIVPEYGRGRAVFIARKLKVSQEAVRKWFDDEARPRVNKMRELAKLLEVDEAWLSLGIKPEMDRKEKRIHNQKIEGAVYALFGLFTMAGGQCAFPGSNDPRSEYVDFYAIYQGTQYALHVSVARETTKGVYEFLVPHSYNDVRCVGIVYLGGTRFHIIDLRRDLIEKHKEKKSGQFCVRISRKETEYITGADTWPRISNVTDLSP